MRVIFLDVDGVLNSNNTKERIYVGHKRYRGIDKNLLELFKTLYDNSNKIEPTRVVITSPWRYNMNKDNVKIDTLYERLIENFEDMEIKSIGGTPRDIVDDRFRGREIHDWIIQNLSIYDVSGFVILDDDFLDFEKYPDINNRFVKVDSEDGLTDFNVDLAIKKLGYRTYYRNFRQ